MSILRGSAWAVLAALTAACAGGSAERSASAGGATHTPCVECMEAGGAASGGAAAQGGQVELAGASDSAGASAADAAGAAGDSDGATVTDDGVAISEVSFWQTVRVPLELAGSPAPASAPIILNKDGILRLYVAPGAQFRTRTLTAALAFGPSPQAAALTSTKLIRAATVDGDFATSFNFPIDAANVVAGSSYSVVLQDGPSGAVLDRYPALGQAALSLVSAGKPLNVVVVPLVVAGVVPSTSADTLATFRSRVLSMYPLSDLTISAHAPVTSNIVVGPSKGWDRLLDALYALRASDGPPDNVYYFGLFTPAKRFDDYCVNDCTVGLSNVADPDEVEARGSIGLGIFSDGSNSDAPDTMAHELGHALGRNHAPCGGAASPDRHFPYPDGKIGVWGFDSLNHLLLDPNLYGDVMGYCSPNWISDYTYDAIFTRISHVNASVAGAQALRLELASSTFRRVLVGARGELAWGSRFSPSHGPSGEPRALTLLGPGGTALGSVTGYFKPFSDASGGFLSVPEAALAANSGTLAIRLGSAELSLSTPKP